MGLTKRTGAERSRRAEAVGACRLPLRSPLRLPTRRDVLEYIPSLLPSVLLSLVLSLSIAVSLPPSPAPRRSPDLSLSLSPSRPFRSREQTQARTLPLLALYRSSRLLSALPPFIAPSFASHPARLFNQSFFFLSLLNNARYSTSERTPSRPR